MYISPEVRIKETDLSTSVPQVASSITGCVGQFHKGPALERKLITSVRTLETTFGTPTDANYVDWYTAWNILQYNQTLFVVRALADDATNSGLGVTSAEVVSTLVADRRINDDVEFDANNITFNLNEVLRILARYPGEYGNDLKVSVCDSTNYTVATVSGSTVFADYFDRATIETDEIAIIVHDVDPNDPTQYIVVESFICSTDPAAKDYNGNSTWVGEYITRNSQYVCAFTDQSSTFSVFTFVQENLVEGVDGTLDTGDFDAAYDLFANSEEFDINIIVDNHNTGVFSTDTAVATSQQYIIDNICETRKDCMVVLSPFKDVVVSNPGSEVTDLITYVNTTLNRSTSYGALYGNWKYQYDRYNDKFRWIPMSGDIAGIYARNDLQREVWFAPAGLNRGQVKNVQKFGFNPDKSSRDLMHKNNVNIVTAFPGDGPVVFSQKTLLRKPSSFGDVDVRRLFMYMEKAISTAAKYFLFEKNTPFTRRQMFNMIDPFLRDIVGREGITDYRVIVDSTNNTGEVIDRNEMIVDIYVKPTRSIYYLQLNFINTKTGVNFEEIIPRQ
ncbi:MAG: phage tail sheath subtilisin-like domain-containing protein [Bacteroidales bacterium]|jgi:phage tail sheath protein FI|nr:phage tail sheath subtilisin-like domain-containing protein [Bacteroidales bacterium]